jgi:nicotinate-nucleotide pyrophosphorylase (carboxylating)
MDSALNRSQLQDLVRRALAEDIGHGDVTTLAVVPPTTVGHGVFIAKGDGVVAGLDVAAAVFAAMDEAIEFTSLSLDGAATTAGEKLAVVDGPAGSILTAERTALNLLQHLSGIATLTARFVAAVAGTKAAILDTRKTTPGLRTLEKYAVRAGGGRNHRLDLSGGILIKDNHIRVAGGIEPAVARARECAPVTLRVEVETQSLDQVQEAIAAGADIIMLDNLSLEAMEQAVRLIDGRALTEASGNVSLETVARIARTGVDFISVGALTHSAPALDISLEVEIEAL